MLRLRWKNLKAGKISDIKVKLRGFCCFFLVQTFKVVFAKKTVNFSIHYCAGRVYKVFIHIYKYLYNFISSKAAVYKCFTK